MGSKGMKRTASHASASGYDDVTTSNPTKKSKTTIASTTMGKDKDGNPFWELSNKRRVGISTFKDMTMINIREYYEKDGETLPGKKGISLSLQQYDALVSVLPAINAQLRQMGHGVEEADEDAGGGAMITSEAAPEKSSSKKKKKTKSKSKRANIEATSDEEEEEDDDDEDDDGY